ncbi:IS3 family transposase [bacterium]|nr:IS3 family transposase [bacterium]
MEAKEWKNHAFRIMDECKGADLSVKRMCGLLSCSRSGYYRTRKQKHPGGSDLELRSQIQQIALQWPCYGYRRVTAELQRQGVHVNRKRVLRLMRADNLLCIRKKRFIRTTRSDHGFVVYPNLAAGMQPTGLDQLWVADITYIRLLREFIFLAVILDAFSRRCIGWQLSRYIDTELTLAALRMALEQRHASPGLIHHSDQGVQYAATEYVELLIANQIRISMSRRANPYDNAQAESFMKTLKYEEVHLFEYQNLNQAYRRIAYFLEDVYNRKRLQVLLRRRTCEVEKHC